VTQSKEIRLQTALQRYLLRMLYICYREVN